jgi:serine O-acetyltransferase
VGIPARIIEPDASREAAAAPRGFTAYGVTLGDDPVAQAMKGLIDSAAGQEHQIALIWQAIEKLSQAGPSSEDCVPEEAHTTESFDAAKLQQLVK